MIAKRFTLIFFLGLVSTVALPAQADIVYFTLNDVILDDETQMTGTFSWVYDAGDFENGVGQFISLDIPWTPHDQDDLEAAFDIGNSIEITLPGSVHDDGVDIKLALVQPLTPTTSSLLDLDLSKYEIGGNGFHNGVFLSGEIAPVPEPAALFVLLGLAGLGISLCRRRPGLAHWDAGKL